MKKKKGLILKIFYTFIGIVCIWTGMKSIEISNIIKTLDYQIVAAEKELMESKVELETLEEERTAMDTPEYIEKVAREKLGMVKKDDVVFKQK